MYYKYLQYVIKHKYYVMIECFKVGLYWRGLVHDMSKFRPSEFIPYARYFYGDYPDAKHALAMGNILTKLEVKHHKAPRPGVIIVDAQQLLCHVAVGEVCWWSH